MQSDRVLMVLQKRHPNDLWFTEVRDGASWNRSHHRLDALAIRPSWSDPRFVGYEVKVARSDFLRDDKWLAYLPLTHQFSFACPWEMIQRTELPDAVGLYWVREDGTLKQVRKPVLRPMEGLPTDLLYHLVLSHLRPDHHPFFTDQVAYLQAWVEDRNNGALLGQRVASKLIQRVATLQEEHRQWQGRAIHAEQDLEAIRHILEPRGLWRDGGGRRWDALEEALDRQPARLAIHTRRDLEAARELIDEILHEGGMDAYGSLSEEVAHD